MRSFQDGTRQGPNGFGFSVQTAPGMTVDALAKGGSFPNSRISVSTVKKLESIPGVVVNWSTVGYGAYHGTVNIPDPPPLLICEAISRAFRQRPNPYVVPRER